MKPMKLKAAKLTAVQLLSAILIILSLVWFSTMISPEVAASMLLFGFFSFGIWMIYKINLSQCRHEEIEAKLIQEKHSKSDLK